VNHCGVMKVIRNRKHTPPGKAWSSLVPIQTDRGVVTVRKGLIPGLDEVNRRTVIGVNLIALEGWDEG